MSDEKVSLDELVYDNYLERHNLAVVRVEWILDEVTGLTTPHVFTEYKPNGQRDSKTD